ncbi:MAG: hypothetical protein JWL82_599 [Parcubacteria group bacterium]|nr:hypothetical protein [Parcubacteria group bacterium]
MAEKPFEQQVGEATTLAEVLKLYGQAKPDQHGGMSEQEKLALTRALWMSKDRDDLETICAIFEDQGWGIFTYRRELTMVFQRAEQLGLSK